ncbi:uncharacterized protein LOC6605352 isoform X3 [Drosophila sechellia]|uniref:uncharacterized protein LOC6605352 isoform X3 n=1 Tax=Drosophila sechellia TaxID=7238 RepID=UPI0013DD9709|nr:uncharacterized protein LOC6605352 isoform X3 [Drosophila sechellia]
MPYFLQSTEEMDMIDDDIYRLPGLTILYNATWSPGHRDRKGRQLRNVSSKTMQNPIHLFFII